MLRGLIKDAISLLPFSLKYEVFYQSGRSLGVNGYQANGNLGPMFGHMYDQTIIKSYLRNREWSANLTAEIQRLFAASSRPGTFYDVGSNIGLVLLSVAANTNVKCLGFEPDSGNFALLEANTIAHGYKNVELFNVAVADKKGQLRLRRSEYNSGDHRLARDGDVVVDCIRLDDLPIPTSPFAVKIDTQGAEPAIFEGGEKTLAAADLIIAEYWPWGMSQMGRSPEPIIDIASRYFTRGLVVQHGESIGRPVPISDVVEQLRTISLSGGEFDWADLVLVGRGR